MTREAEVLRTMAGLRDFEAHDVATYCAAETALIRRVVARPPDLFARSADSTSPGRSTRWTVKDAQALREMLQAPLADDLEIVEQDPDVDADRLGRAASRLTGAGRLLETLDGLDGDTRRRTRRLVVALLKGVRRADARPRE